MEYDEGQLKWRGPGVKGHQTAHLLMGCMGDPLGQWNTRPNSSNWDTLPITLQRDITNTAVTHLHSQTSPACVFVCLCTCSVQVHVYQSAAGGKWTVIVSSCTSSVTSHNKTELKWAQNIKSIEEREMICVPEQTLWRTTARVCTSDPGEDALDRALESTSDMPTDREMKTDLCFYDDVTRVTTLREWRFSWHTYIVRQLQSTEISDVLTQRQTPVHLKHTHTRLSEFTSTRLCVH